MTQSRIPSLNWLRVFETAARHESFARAAAELNMSAAAVSQQIVALEGHLGAQLFLRGANRVELSPKGADFLPTVQASLQSIDAKAETLFRPHRTERITVRASQLMVMSWLPRPIADFEAQHPGVRVAVLMDGDHRDERADITIQFTESGSGIATHGQLMMIVTHGAVGRRQDIDAIRTAGDLLACRLFDVASHNTGWRQLLAGLGGMPAGQPPMIEVVDTTPLALLMVSQGLGLSVAHFPVCAPLARSLDLRVCPLVPEVAGPGRYFIELSEEGRRRSAVLALRDHLLSYPHEGNPAADLSD